MNALRKMMEKEGIDPTELIGLAALKTPAKTRVARPAKQLFTDKKGERKIRGGQEQQPKVLAVLCDHQRGPG